jgi:hypothetical protein
VSGYTHRNTANDPDTMSTRLTLPPSAGVKHGPTAHYAAPDRHHGSGSAGGFDERDDAQRAVWRLERQRQDARIEVVHRHR